MNIINVRECPEWLARAADYFSSRWNIDRALYLDSIGDSISTSMPMPRWYLMLRGEDIVGGFGLIENDFMARTDLCPWLCAVYIEPAERGMELGSRLLEHGRREAAKLGYGKVYLNTDHVGYYEKYGWRYMGDFAHQGGSDTRVYEADAIAVAEEARGGLHEALEKMGDFFDARADIYDRHMIGDLGLDVFYEAVSGCFCTPVRRLLDLGCGSGLELDRLFARFPDMEVTGIDMSAGLLEKLKEKYPERKLQLICGSYFDVDFGGTYSHAISTYSLHHFDEKSKLGLFRRIHAALEPGGAFVFGDYTVPTLALQREMLDAGDEMRRAQGIPEGEHYHVDIPFAPETELRLMREAGFASAEIVRQWENTTIFVAHRH